MPIVQDPNYVPLKTQFRGGVDTVRPPSLLPVGGYSTIQNMRQLHPGMKKREGMSKLHTVPDGSNKTVSLFQLSKGRTKEINLYAQQSNGRVLRAISKPPKVTTGNFGDVVLNGSSEGQIPASWSVLGDILIYSDGSGGHKISVGDKAYVDKFILFSGIKGPARDRFIEGGTDYSIEVGGWDKNNKYAQIGGGNTSVMHEIFFKTLLKPNKFNIEMVPGYTNSRGNELAIEYWKDSMGSWIEVPLEDTTRESDASFNKSGYISFDAPNDCIPIFLFGETGYWLRMAIRGATDDDVRIASVTYEADWQDTVSMWDGVPADAIEVQVYDATTYAYKKYSSDNVKIDGHMATSNGDKIYILTSDPIEGIYIDVGESPNTNDVFSMHVWPWNGEYLGFVSYLRVYEYTDYFKHSGCIFFSRYKDTNPAHFNGSQHYSYIYALAIGNTLHPPSDTTVGIKVMPYFDITELGNGLCNCVWKDRALYVFENTPNFIHVSAIKNPQVIEGDDSSILKAGDGRANRVVCMKKFYNELMVWQEEKGAEGGCVTLFEGYSPATFGKLVLSTRIGTFSAKSVVVVEDTRMVTTQEDKIKTSAYWISNMGIYKTDGTIIQRISEGFDNQSSIQNLFDPSNELCINRKYSSDFWIGYDSAYTCLRLGLRCGARGKWIYPVYDIQDRTWSFDVIDAPDVDVSCFAEIEAGSGDIPLIQVGGGANDGTIYRLNTGYNDVDTPIDARVVMEVDGYGEILNAREMVIRTESGGGTCTMKIYEDGVEMSPTYTIP